MDTKDLVIGEKYRPSLEAEYVYAAQVSPQGERSAEDDEVYYTHPSMPFVYVEVCKDEQNGEFFRFRGNGGEMYDVSTYEIEYLVPDYPIEDLDKTAEE